MKDAKGRENRESPFVRFVSFVIQRFFGDAVIWLDSRIWNSENGHFDKECYMG